MSSVQPKQPFSECWPTSKKVITITSIGAALFLIGVVGALYFNGNFNLIEAHRFSPLDLSLIGGAIAISGLSILKHKEGYRRAALFTTLLALSFLFATGSLLSHQFLNSVKWPTILLGSLAGISFCGALGKSFLDDYRKVKLMEALIGKSNDSHSPAPTPDHFEAILKSDPSLVKERFSFKIGEIVVNQETILHAAITIAMERDQIGNDEITVLEVIAKYAQEEGVSLDMILDSHGKLPVERITKSHLSSNKKYVTAFSNNFIVVSK